MNQLDHDPTRTLETVLSLPEGSPAKLPAVLMFGMPGVGKGTQGSLLGTMTGMFHVSTGAIFRNLDPASDVLILDGIPRRFRQCELLENYVEVLSVIHLEAASDEPIVERLLERAKTQSRPDDADEQIIRRRFEIYREMTRPVLDYYSPDIVHNINPLGTQMEVKKRILECVIPAIRQYERAI